MRHQYTPGQLRLQIHRAEALFDRAIAQSLALDPGGKHVARIAHAPVQAAVLELIALFREQLPGAAEVASRLARLYADDADAGAPTLDCLRAIAELTLRARERYVPLASDTGGVRRDS